LWLSLLLTSADAQCHASSRQLNAWHHQSDGWLSPSSAVVYDASTESLFIGRQDAMQRSALSLLCRHLRGDACGDGGAPPSPDASTAPRVLDVAAGTGRLLTFVRDEFPSAAATALDLSPFYLAEARDAHAHWEELRGNGRHGGATFVQAAAEAMPFPDASFDAVTCMYLFHEIPPESRTQVAAEISRVLRPGGVAVVGDSVQLGDRPALDAGLGRFGDFNEVRRLA
jgi:ubiquinone/menaquinone biosynthesis C-methylase UbiE